MKKVLTLPIQKISSSVTVVLCGEGRCLIFSSLSKLFVIRKEENKKLNLWIEGQPKIHATFGNMKRPVALEVNGKVLPVDYEHEAVKVKAQK